MAFAVSQRISEIGLRLALGARRVNVMGIILKEASLMLTVIGLAIGLVGSVFVGRTICVTGCMFPYLDLRPIPRVS
jgi:putative ABC transport system permease protein